MIGTKFYKELRILKGPEVEARKDSVLILNGRIKAFGEEAEKEAIRNKKIEKGVKVLRKGLAGGRIVAESKKQFSK